MNGSTTGNSKDADTDIEKPSHLLFGRVWEITKELNENIRHYNEHQTKYRSLASQWLLGCFAAIGFVLVSKLELPFDKLWLLPVISVVTALGIYQLWRMDIPVFQKLISAFFVAGLDMELKYKFLPRVKINIVRSVKQNSAGFTLFNFYFIIIMVLLLIAASTLLYLAIPPKNVLIIVLGYCLLAAGLIYLYRYMKLRSGGIREKEGEPEQEPDPKKY